LSETPPDAKSLVGHYVGELTPNAKRIPRLVNSVVGPFTIDLMDNGECEVTRFYAAEFPNPSLISSMKGKWELDRSVSKQWMVRINLQFQDPKPGDAHYGLWLEGHRPPYQLIQDFSEPDAVEGIIYTKVTSETGQGK